MPDGGWKPNPNERFAASIARAAPAKRPPAHTLCMETSPISIPHWLHAGKQGAGEGKGGFVARER